jgi:hypothetical protein
MARSKRTGPKLNGVLAEPIEARGIPLSLRGKESDDEAQRIANEINQEAEKKLAALAHHFFPKLSIAQCETLKQEAPGFFYRSLVFALIKAFEIPGFQVQFPGEDRKGKGTAGAPKRFTKRELENLMFFIDSARELGAADSDRAAAELWITATDPKLEKAANKTEKTRQVNRLANIVSEQRVLARVNKGESTH